MRITGAIEEMTLNLHTPRWREGTPLVEYQIARELDSSPGGVLYSAFHQQSHERAAIVVLRLRESGDPPFLSRVEAASEIRHPHIAALKELWRMDELVFLVAEHPGKQPNDRVDQQCDEQHLHG